MTIAIAWLLGLLSAAGIGFTAYAAWAVTALDRAEVVRGEAEPVSLLKPLYGAEPTLAENLAGFLDQDWHAPIQLVAGVQRADDPALAAVAAIERQSDDREVTLVLDPTPHGANAKVANLINMAPAARHDLLVLSDSDMAVPRDYLARIAGTLAVPGTGAVSCLYRGRGDAGGWSRLAAAGISYQFLPLVVVGLRLGLATPCMGSTIALRRDTLAAIGGFARFGDRLADDYDIGVAVRALGLTVAVPPLILTHGCTETTLAAVWRHERRWAATLCGIDPWGHSGSIVTFPVPLALLTIAFAPRVGLALLVAAALARYVLKLAVDRVAGARTAPAWMLVPRDCLSFASFIAAFFTRSVDWRGTRLRMGTGGDVSAATEISR